MDRRQYLASIITAAACALVDKHLRVMEANDSVPYIKPMRAIFAKRWQRWHRPIHSTLVYALDPCYQSHQLSRQEMMDCKQVLKKLGGAD